MIGYLEKGIQAPMAQGRSTQTISIIEWIQTSRLSIKNSLSRSRHREHIMPAHYSQLCLSLFGFANLQGSGIPPTDSRLFAGVRSPRACERVRRRACGDSACWRDQRKDAQNADLLFTSSASPSCPPAHLKLMLRGAPPGLGPESNRPRQRLKGSRRPLGASAVRRSLQRARGPASRSRH